MRKIKKWTSIVLTLALVCTMFAFIGSAGAHEDEQIFVPLWMQPHTVIIYDEEMNYEIVQGGELTAEDIAGRVDIEAVGLTSTSENMLASPNIKVEYDLHGFIQNIYYPVPGQPGEYQLSNPLRTRAGSGIIAPGEIYTYPETYYNFNSGKNQHCTLARSADGKKMTGVGRITYYTGTMGEGGTHRLVAYDCATKMDQDDVTAGTKITAKNQKNNKSQYYYKYDVGGMPGAILDIWSDSTTNPITDLTDGEIDNVYSGAINHPVP